MMTVCFFTKLAVLSYLQNQKFCLTYRIGGIVSYLKTAVLYRYWNRRFVSFKTGGFVLTLNQNQFEKSSPKW